MTRKPSVFLGLAETTVTNGLATILGVATGIMVSRLLGPAERGTLAAMQNWAGVLFGFGALGITTATGYYSAREPGNSGALLMTATVSLLLWSVPLVATMFFLLPVLLTGQPHSVIQHARLYLLMVPVQFAIGVAFSVLQGMSHFRLWNILRFQGPLAWALALIAAWNLSIFTAAPLLIIYLVFMAAVAVVFLVCAFRAVRGRVRFRPELMPPLLRYGLPTFLTGVPQFLNLRLDQLLMSGLLPPRILGEYVVAVAWSGSLSALLTSVSQILFPTLASIHDRESRILSLRRALRLSAVLSLALTAVVAPLTPFCLPLFYGEAFRPAVPAGLILVVAGCFATFNQIAGEAARGMGLTKYPLYAEAAGLAVTGILLTALLKRYELLGAALASLMSYATTMTVLTVLLAKSTGSRCSDLMWLTRGDLIYVCEMVRVVLRRNRLAAGPQQ